MIEQNNTSIVTLSPAKSRSLVILLLGFVPLVGMGIDLIAPSLPAISHSLQVSPIVAKNLIAVYLLGATISSVLSGILSDTWGRRHLICSSFILLVIVSLLPPLWPHASILLLSRFLQGFAIGIFAVLIRSVMADLLTGTALLRTASWIATMWGIGPIIGPIIGGYLQVYIGWQANFLFFACYGFLGACVCLRLLPETHHKRTPLNLTRIKTNFSLIFSSKLFIATGLLMGCLYSILIVFNALAPFFIEKWLGYSPIFFGHAAFYLGLIFLCGTFCCRVFIKRFSGQYILKIGVPSVLAFALIGVFVAYHSHNAWTIIVPNAFLFFSCGVLYPTCMGITMNMFRELAGSASAAVTLINLGVTTSAGFIASMINTHSAKPIAWTSTGFVAFGFIIYLATTYVSIQAKAAVDKRSTES